ncbi:MAG: deoxyguanosinetriphosphate triphosphohydrolase [Anaerolineae bacterium]|nr:deoxyguanosinetriphosphate triphosphohydrolase [Anaerolineae bacterium]MDQ7034399.1 deoxyguanosinetriphosphate triphosphohydrolase [Anaerolineae bacterium]
MIVTRKQLEEHETQILAPYALLSKDSKGRFHHDHEPEYRTAFQRDRDRIIHAEAFRKLEYKTQVFVNDAGDYYRTRLTHTLEVAQIGRTLARALGVNEDLTETICLAHDLGHPPFGHAGEDVLNKLMVDDGGFNHNHQSYRVVTEIERRYPLWSGLNLTVETLEGIAKHETEYDASGTTSFDPDTRGSVEAQIADVADELAYNAHDLDDGLKSGLITTEQLNELEIWQILCDRLKWSGYSLSEVQRHQFIRELVGILVGDVLKTTTQHITDKNIQSVDDVIQQSENIVGYSEDQKMQNRALKDFLYQNMYYHYRIVRMKQRAEHYIARLFESYLHEPRQLPNEFQSQIDKIGIHRVVADYIASMTDRSALLEYRQLFDPMMRP